MNGLRLLKEAKVSVLKEKVFLTDKNECLRLDAVFPICAENVFFFTRLSVKENGTVLDLCTGSGIMAILAAGKAQEVVGVDVNPRAIAFAQLNAELNELEGKIQFRAGNLFGPVNGRTFDTITANPPFEPVPEGWSYFLHSDGGPSGLRVVDEICAGVRKHLKPDGVFQMVTYSGPPSRTRWYALLRSAFSGVTIEKVKTVDGAVFRDRLVNQLRSLNPGRGEPPVSAIGDLALWFVSASS
jgi:methylase of polypeptide subunit release factors